MRDSFGRTIDYMRVSITDRCNLRCIYCMPQGVELVRHSDILSYEELLRLCRQAVALGITKFKITGGEPLVRKDCAGFIGRLKQIPGVRQVTLTTNGLLLSQQLDALLRAGIDAVNISADTLDETLYRQLTGFSQPQGGIRAVVEECAQSGIPTKVNAVLLRQTQDEIESLAALAAEMAVDVRFIELMPIGQGGAMEGVPMEEALARLRVQWPDLHAVGELRGNGPARYYAAEGLAGRIGFISAISGQFCGDCNRVRLTGTGELKPCLCYDAGADLRGILRSGAPDETLREAMAACIGAKPLAHCFARAGEMTEMKTMNRIGG